MQNTRLTFTTWNDTNDNNDNNNNNSNNNNTTLCPCRDLTDNNLHQTPVSREQAAWNRDDHFIDPQRKLIITDCNVITVSHWLATGGWFTVNIVLLTLFCDYYFLLTSGHNTSFISDNTFHFSKPKPAKVGRMQRLHLDLNWFYFNFRIRSVCCLRSHLINQLIDQWSSCLTIGWTSVRSALINCGDVVWIWLEDIWRVKLSSDQKLTFTSSDFVTPYFSLSVQSRITKSDAARHCFCSCCLIWINFIVWAEKSAVVFMQGRRSVS